MSNNNNNNVDPFDVDPLESLDPLFIDEDEFSSEQTTEKLFYPLSKGLLDPMDEFNDEEITKDFSQPINSIYCCCDGPKKHVKNGFGNLEYDYCLKCKKEKR